VELSRAGQLPAPAVRTRLPRVKRRKARRKRPKQPRPAASKKTRPQRIK
jgi:hypothetical protein